jgi:hypothetical protein
MRGNELRNRLEELNWRTPTPTIAKGGDAMRVADYKAADVLSHPISLKAKKKKTA